MRILQGHQRAIRAVAYSPEPVGLLASASEDGTVRLWDANTYEPRTVLKTHPTGASCLAFSCDGALLATGGKDGIIHFWDVASLQHETAWTTRAGEILSLLFLPGEYTLYAVPNNQHSLDDPGTILVWDFENGITENQDWPSAVKSLAFSRSPAFMAVAELERSVQVWQLGESKRQTILRFAHTVRGLAYSPQPGARTLAVASGNIIEIWDTGALRRMSICEGHRLDILTLTFSPDGLLLLSGSRDKTVRLWDAAGRQRVALDWNLGSIHSVAFAPHGQTAAVGGQQPEIIVWDVDDP